MKRLSLGLSALSLLAGCGRSNVTTNALARTPGATTQTNMTIEKITKTHAEWQKQLTPEPYRVTRKHGPERAFAGQYWNHHEKGISHCVACDLELFSADTQFDSGTGWPGFSAPIADHVGMAEDHSFFLRRIEVRCARCDSHLGHVFADGPKPTGRRYLHPNWIRR